MYDVCKSRARATSSETIAVAELAHTPINHLQPSLHLMIFFSSLLFFLFQRRSADLRIRGKDRHQFSSTNIFRIRKAKAVYVFPRPCVGKPAETAESIGLTVSKVCARPADFTSVSGLATPNTRRLIRNTERGLGLDTAGSGSLSRRIHHCKDCP